MIFFYEYGFIGFFGILARIIGVFRKGGNRANTTGISLKSTSNSCEESCHNFDCLACPWHQDRIP